MYLPLVSALGALTLQPQVLQQALLPQEQLQEPQLVQQVLLHIELPPNENDFYTLGGLVLEQLQHIPQEGESFDLAGFCFRVLSMEGRRISQVEVTLMNAVESAE